jgi:hypothetical protein
MKIEKLQYTEPFLDESIYEGEKPYVPERIKQILDKINEIIEAINQPKQ